MLDFVGNIFKLGHGVVSLFLCLCLSALLISFDNSEKTLFHQVATATVLSPVTSILIFKEKYFWVYRENAKLREENSNLRVENDFLKQHKIQNARMREMLNFKTQLPYRLIPGEVIARDPGRHGLGWTLNLGSQDSISINMPVLTTKGVVGKIARVYSHSSLVQLIHAPTSKVSVLNQRSRAMGILETYKIGQLIARFPAHSDVMLGDTLVTSGMGGVFPKGFAIGEVIEEQLQTSDIIKGVGVREFQKVEGVEEIFVFQRESDWVVGER